jgi:hypothetical protein
LTPAQELLRKFVDGVDEMMDRTGNLQLTGEKERGSIRFSR